MIDRFMGPGDKDLPKGKLPGWPCVCVLRDHVDHDRLPPICDAFAGHDGEFGWVCATCGHERECHPAAPANP